MLWNAGENTVRARQSNMDFAETGPENGRKMRAEKNGKGLLDGGESYAFEGEVDPEQGVETGVLQQPTGLVLEYLEMVG